MKKREAQFQTAFNHWLRAHGERLFTHTAVFELKQTTGGSLPFSRVEKHQLNWLLAAKRGGVPYKIPDDTRSYKPFDCTFFLYCFAYVVILFPSKDFYLIDIDAFLNEQLISHRKSITEDRARKIATHRGNLSVNGTL